MYLIFYWIFLVVSFGLFVGGLFVFVVEEVFDFWNECVKVCVFDFKDGVCFSCMSVDLVIVDINGQGVLYYFMVLEGGNDVFKLVIDNVFSIISDGLIICFEGGVELNKLVCYSYMCQVCGSWLLNWLVLIGYEKFLNIKVFIYELNVGNQFSYMLLIYIIEMGDELLVKLVCDVIFFVRVYESNEMQLMFVISYVGVSVVMVQVQLCWEKCWSEWVSGKVLCLFDLLDGVYNYFVQQCCKFDDIWEGKIYWVFVGNLVKYDLDIKFMVISYCLYFFEGGSLVVLIVYQVCYLLLEIFICYCQLCGWE